VAEKKARAEKSFTAEERQAMKEAAAERRRASKKMSAEELEAEVLAKISAMAAADRKIGEGLHALVKKIAPQLQAKTWYGMPAYNLDGKSVVFFQDAGKFKARYSTLGFNDSAKLDDGNLWPTSFAILDWNKEIEAQVAELIKRAVA
jgi:uncharacterized protein YdhG (YjbR/CyaY superfamily)